MTTLPPRTASRPELTLIQRAGFTLIELSIVLVIIGLIVGGVLVGQDLIRAAEIRATVGQVEKYNSAVNTFRTKYNGIPGDLLAAQATAFGICGTGGSANCTGATGLGDGNGIVNDTASGSAGIGEPILFWQELSNANLVDGSLGQAVVTGGAVPTALTSSTINTTFPAAKIGRGNSWFAGNNGAGQNFYILSGATAMTTAGVYTFTNNLTPIEAYNMDVKLDDGLPNTGVVQARGNIPNASSFGELGTPPTNYATNGTGATSTCTSSAAVPTDPAATYNRGTAAGSSPNCALRFRFN